jgi:hypothetical protein
MKNYDYIFFFGFLNVKKIKLENTPETKKFPSKGIFQSLPKSLTTEWAVLKVIPFQNYLTSFNKLV